MSDIFPVSGRDYPALAQFLSSTEEPSRGEEFWKARLRFWWEENPAFTENLERGWGLQKNGKLTGFIGRIPVFFQQERRVVTAFSVTTWRVLPEYRNQSMKLLFQFLKASEKNLLFDTTPDKAVAQILERSGFKPLPPTDSKMGFSILNPEKVLARKLGKPAAKLAALALRLFERRPQNDDGAIRIEKADSSFDKLWEGTRDLYSNTNVRTKEVLNWYCFGNPDFRKELFGFYEGGILQGYAVGWGRTGKKFKEFECVDLWSDPRAGEKVRVSLVRALIGHARKNSFDLVFFPHFDRHSAELFKTCGLFQKKIERGDRYFKMPSKEKGEFTPENSYFVGVQGDYGL